MPSYISVASHLGLLSGNEPRIVTSEFENQVSGHIPSPEDPELPGMMHFALIL